MLISLKKIARIQARMRDTQKLRQKSQLNNLEITLGALAIIASLIPVLPNSKIINAGTKIKYISAQNGVMECTTGIIL